MKLKQTVDRLFNYMFRQTRRPVHMGRCRDVRPRTAFDLGGWTCPENAHRRSVTSIMVDLAPFFTGSMLKMARGRKRVIALSRRERGMMPVLRNSIDTRSQDFVSSACPVGKTSMSFYPMPLIKKALVFHLTWKVIGAEANR